MFRTDKHNNPAAVTTDIARQAGLKEHVEWETGDPFSVKEPGKVDNIILHTYFTAILKGDPIALTIKIIDSIGYYTKYGTPRWTYMAIPHEVWNVLNYDQKKQAVAAHYRNEGGETMKHLFVTPSEVNVQVDDTMHMEDKVNG
jgi:hypothetical protein